MTRALLLVTLVLATSGCFSLQPRAVPRANQADAASPETCESLKGTIVPTYWLFSPRDPREAQCNLEVTPTTVGWIAMPVYVPAVIIGVLTSPMWAPFTED